MRGVALTARVRRSLSLLVLTTLAVTYWLSAARHADAIPAPAPADNAPGIATSPATDAARELATPASATPAPQYATAHEAADTPPPMRILTVHRGDTLSSLFASAGLPPAELHAVMALGGETRSLAKLHPGERIALRSNGDGQLAELRYALSPLDMLLVTRDGDELQERVEHAQATRRKVVVVGEVRHSLALAMRRAGLSSRLAAEFADIFHWKVDFRRDIRRGTRFSVIYDKLYRGKHALGTGGVVAAELDLGKRTLRALRFVDDKGETRYFDPRGHSLKPSLLRTPLHYTRISSPFSLHRFDPVVHKWRPHEGVDLAAPRGTPVKAAGDGTVRFLGWMHGYGRLVKLRHFGPYTTRYAHLGAFAKGLHVGSHVTQGQVIGYVGSSGEATGPHLHFEIRVNGKAHNPLKVALPNARPLTGRQLARFQHANAPLLAALAAPNTRQAQLALAAARPGNERPPAERSAALAPPRGVHTGASSSGDTVSARFAHTTPPSS